MRWPLWIRRRLCDRYVFGRLWPVPRVQTSGPRRLGPFVLRVTWPPTPPHVPSWLRAPLERLAIATSPGRFGCGRRPWPHQIGADYWRTERNGDLTCSYCGSLHPDMFLALCRRIVRRETGATIDWSDKPYKCYVAQPGVRNATEGAVKFYVWHFEQDHRDRAAELNAMVAEAERISRQMLEAQARRLMTRSA